MKLNRELAGDLTSMIDFNFILFLKRFIYFISVSVCLHACACAACVKCLRRPEKGIAFPGTRVIDGREPLCECWEWNAGPLQKQQCS